MAMRTPDGEWRCDGNGGPYAFRCAKRVLTEMGDVSIAATLDWFENCGATCDCSIFARLGDEAGKIAFHTSARTIRRIIPLFCVTSNADLGRYRNVRIEWVVSRRPVPLFGPGSSTGLAYHHIIDYYDDMMYDAKRRKDSEMCADEFFTADEAKAFVAWMWTHRKVRASIDPFEVPLFEVFGLASSAGTEVGLHRLPVSDDPDYDLPFGTTGYWSEVDFQNEPPHRM
jgi:hypothetical protein